MLKKALDRIERARDRDIEYRLKRWATWRAKVLTGSLGYPHRSTIGRIRDDGGIVSRSTRPPEMPYDAIAEEMDGLVWELEQYKKSCATALRVKYTGQGDISAQLRELKMPQGTFNLRIKMAKMWLAGRITV